MYNVAHKETCQCCQHPNNYVPSSLVLSFPTTPLETVSGSATNVVRRSCKGEGWTNLLNYVRSWVGPLLADLFDSVQQQNKSWFTSYVLHASNAEHDVFKWIEWIVTKNLPLSVVDDPLTREALCYKSITSKLLHKHILSVCNIMKESVSASFPTNLQLYLMAGLKALHTTLESQLLTLVGQIIVELLPLVPTVSNFRLCAIHCYQCFHFSWKNWRNDCAGSLTSFVPSSLSVW